MAHQLLELLELSQPEVFINEMCQPVTNIAFVHFLVLQNLLKRMLHQIEEDGNQVVGPPRNTMCEMRNVRPLGTILYMMGAFGRC